MKKVARILVLGALLAPLSATAVPITVNFTITATSVLYGASVPSIPGGSYAGYPGGTVGGGSVTFDDSIGPGTDLEVGFPTIDLEFSWLGQSFTEAEAVLFHVGYDPFGALSSWTIGALQVSPSGCRLNCVSIIGATDFFLTGTRPLGVRGGSGLMHVGGFDGIMRGEVSWTVAVTSVPEPTTLGLLGIGLAGMALARRRRKA